MRAPDILVIDYAHDRRAHRHRCQGCNKIVNAGEPVYMARVANKKTRVVHREPCADQVTFDEMTHLQRLVAHAFDYLNHRTHTAAQAAEWALANVKASQVPHE